MSFLLGKASMTVEKCLDGLESQIDMHTKFKIIWTGSVMITTQIQHIIIIQSIQPT